MKLVLCLECNFLQLLSYLYFQLPIFQVVNIFIQVCNFVSHSLACFFGTEVLFLENKSSISVSCYLATLFSRIGVKKLTDRSNVIN